MNALKLAALTAAAFCLSAPALAEHPGHGYKKHHQEQESNDQDRDEGRHGDRRDEDEHERRDEHRRAFDDDERGAIARYYREYPRGLGEDEDDEDEHLPPGLAKQHKIPPGWRKKLARGERIPDDVWVHRVPLPPEIVGQLPMPPPPGVVLIRIHNQVVRAVERTHEVLDVLGLPHPPTPRTFPPR